MSSFSGLVKLIRAYAAEYKWYPHRLAWAVRGYDRLLRLFPRLPLPARKRVVQLRFRRMSQPFYLRLGSSDLQLHQTIRFRGEYRPVMNDRFAGPITQVVDLGSNAGYTIRLWRELFPEARIIGVEPDPDNLRVCRLNAESIPGVRLDFVQGCVDGKSGSVWLDRSQPEHQFQISQARTTKGLAVEALTVPQILERAGAEPEISLLKCDVQGAEQAIFANCAHWISRVKNMIVEVHPPYAPEDLLADLKRNGWQWDRHVIHRTDSLPVLFFWGSAVEPTVRGSTAFQATSAATSAGLL